MCVCVLYITKLIYLFNQLLIMLWSKQLHLNNIIHIEFIFKFKYLTLIIPFKKVMSFHYILKDIYLNNYLKKK